MIFQVDFSDIYLISSITSSDLLEIILHADSKVATHLRNIRQEGSM